MIQSSTSYEFPKNIKEFGYVFNEEGKLRSIKTSERFEFYVKPDDNSYNQRHYEALGEAIGEHIEEELVSKYNLRKHVIPVGSEEEGENAVKSRIYLSDDAADCQHLLLLIQGSGVVRPGQWARQVIINDSLELGSMYPYIQKAQELKWGIMIFNPNENHRNVMKDGEISRVLIRGSESSEEHCLYVWDHFVRDSKAKKILIVAHSYGGINTISLLNELAEKFKSRVVAIALTDSVHSSSMIHTQSKKWFTHHSINWIRSHLYVNKGIPDAKKFYGCRCHSAGHPKHEYTSGTAFEHVFDFLKHRLDESYEQINDLDTNKDSNINDMEIDDPGDKKPVESGKNDPEEKSAISTSTSTNALNEMEVDDDANIADAKREKEDCEVTNDTSASTENIVDPKIANDNTVDSSDDKSTESKKSDSEATNNNTSTFTRLTSENVDSTEDSKTKNDISISTESPVEDTVDPDQSENVDRSLNSESDVTPPSTETSGDHNQQSTNVANDAGSQGSTESEIPVPIISDLEPPEEVVAQERITAQGQEDNTETLQQTVLHPDNDQNTKNEVNDMPPKMDIDNESIQRKEQLSVADQVTNQFEEEAVSKPSEEV